MRIILMGKTTTVQKIEGLEHIDKVIDIDQSPKNTTNQSSNLYRSFTNQKSIYDDF
jgi:excinuclease UvrABC ATPase subunit